MNDRRRRAIRGALPSLLAIALSANAVPADCGPEPETTITAADRPLVLTLEQDDRLSVMHVEGAIEPGATRRFEAMHDPGIDEIRFDSAGGDMREALLLGRAIRARRVATRIATGATCAGACAEAFLGGTARFVDRGARIGFTAVPLSDPASGQSQAERETAAARWAEQRADHYIRAGISRGLLRLQLDVPAPGTCWLGPDALRRYNVTNTAQF